MALDRFDQTPSPTNSTQRLLLASRIDARFKEVPRCVASCSGSLERDVGIAGNNNASERVRCRSFERVFNVPSAGMQAARARIAIQALI